MNPSPSDIICTQRPTNRSRCKQHAIWGQRWRWCDDGGGVRWSKEAKPQRTIIVALLCMAGKQFRATNLRIRQTAPAVSKLVKVQTRKLLQVMEIQRSERERGCVCVCVCASVSLRLSACVSVSLCLCTTAPDPDNNNSNNDSPCTERPRPHL